MVFGGLLIRSFALSDSMSFPLNRFPNLISIPSLQRQFIFFQSESLFAQGFNHKISVKDNSHLAESSIRRTCRSGLSPDCTEHIISFHVCDELATFSYTVT